MRTYPSYLGELVECARRLGCRPADFGLRRVLVGGEILTQGLRQRCAEIFGPLEFDENFSMTELAPFGGNLCSAGHLHFEPSVGLVEVSGLDTKGPASAGEAGLLVATPLPPFRDTTLLLRYATEDVVTALEGPLECEMRHTPATGQLLGKFRFSVRHDRGWTMPRYVVEALESDETVPLPARYGFRAVPGGVAVEVLARSDHPSVRKTLWSRLMDRGVPVRELRVVTNREALCQPVPLRADLHETSFAELSPARQGPDYLRELVGSESLRSA
jgi:acyl-CoA synthetase (AMP-forming)/AMP-acid ligase II